MRNTGQPRLFADTSPASVMNDPDNRGTR